MPKIRVLLADDHPVLRGGMRSLLEQEEDLEVVAEAGDGEEAIKHASDLTPDVVLMDIVMPKLNGIEATKQIKQVSPTTAVLILTAYDDDRYVIGLLQAGAAGYLLKSASGKQIVEAIRSVATGDSVLDPAATRRLLSCVARYLFGAPGEPPEGVLSQREMDVLRLASRGMSNKEIALTLNLSMPTVKAHFVNIFNKMGVGSRTEAVIYGLRKGWLTLEDVGT
jgi:NarL family two-component system response regulator LiaR